MQKQQKPSSDDMPAARARVLTRLEHRPTEVYRPPWAALLQQRAPQHMLAPCAHDLPCLQRSSERKYVHLSPPRSMMAEDIVEGTRIR